MTKRKKSAKRVKRKGPIRRLWGFCKVFLLLGTIGAIAGGIWYIQQDEATQRDAQGRAITALDWLVELDQTNRQTDDALNWIIQNIPASRGVVISVGDVEGADRYTFAGIPVSGRPLKILENRGYIVGYDEELRNPAWVAYRLEYNPGGQTAERPHGFDTDTRTRSRVEHSDYTNTGYDRGHMAPNYALGVVFGAEAQTETFLMSNIVPQLPDLNRGPWKDFEQTVAREYLERCEEIWVITGPLYSEPAKRLASGVAVPVAFFKILVDVIPGGSARALALVMPQKVGDEGLDEFLVSIDDIEGASALDFLSLLEDGAEDRLESARAARAW